MPEAPNRISTLARRGLLPLSVAALLAFALVPGVAVAEVGIPQYRDAPPTVTGETRDADPNTGSDGGGTGDAGQSPTGGGSNDGAGSKDGAGDEQGAAGGRDGKGGGKGGAAAIGDGRRTGDGSALPQAIDPDNASSDGGSSPLVPILIALAVLAAISVGVVAMRKKREDADPGAPASPEAG